MDRLLHLVDSEIKRNVYALVLSVFCIITLAASVLHYVENLRYLWPEGYEFTTLSFLDVIYLIVITITTVGYGDIYPVTTPGRLVIMTMMITDVYKRQEGRRDKGEKEV